VIISEQYKFIFLEVPKTGTRSVRSALMRSSTEEYIQYVGSHHSFCDKAKETVSFYMEHIEWGEFFKFAFVRNPWDRIYSNYVYRMEKRKLLHDKERLEHILNEKFISLKEKDKLYKYEYWEKGFLDNLKKIQTFFDSMKGDHRACFLRTIETHEPQSSYFLDKSGQISIDFIGRYENLNKEFGMICDLVGIDDSLNLDTLNKSKYDDLDFSYDYVYTDQAIDEVAKKDKIVIDLKGYNFGCKSSSSSE
jgi:hypothetical protein